MRKFYALLAAAVTAFAAVAITAPSATLAEFQPNPPGAIQLSDGDNLAAARLTKAPAPLTVARKAAGEDTRWGEWTEAGRTSFPDELITFCERISSNVNSEFPEFEQPFAVDLRTSLDDPAVAQLRFRDVFNNVDIVFDLDPESGTIVCSAAPTGIPINVGYPSYNDQFLFNARGIYFAATKRIVLNTVFFLVTGDVGYSAPVPQTLVMEGAPEFRFSVPESAFISSEAFETTVTVDRSEMVAWSRVVNFENSMTAKDLNEYYKLQPDYAVNIYADYTGDRFKVQPFDGFSAIYSSYLVIPFGADNHPLGGYVRCAVYHNHDYHHGVIDWRSLGTGTLKENQAYWGFSDGAERPSEYSHFSSQAQIEISADGTMICVKNPFGPSHPAYGSMNRNTAAGDEDFYMIFDVSDPSRVYVPDALTGMCDSDGHQLRYHNIPARMMFNEGTTQDFIDNREHNLWGKYADKRVIIPVSAMDGYAYGDYDIVLELPGYIDYDITAAGEFSVTDGTYRFPLTYVSPNLASVDYALVPQAVYDQDRNFPERLAKRIAERDPALTVYSAPTNGAASLSVSIPDEGVPYGNSVFIATGRDAQGGYHRAAVVKDIGKARPLDQWRKAGFVKVSDDLIAPIFGSSTPKTFTVELLENPDLNGVYLLADYYKKLIGCYGWEEKGFDAASADPLVLDLRGEYPYLTHDLSGGMCTREMRMGINLPASETQIYQPRLMNAYDYYDSTGNLGTIVRDGEGSVRAVSFADALVCVLYNAIDNSRIGIWHAYYTWIDFTYDVTKDPDIFDNWKPYGKVSVTENIISDIVAPGSEGSCEASVFAHPTLENIYCVTEIFNRMPWNAGEDMEFSGNDGYPFVINATDPSKVHVSPYYTGERSGITWFTGWTQGGIALNLCLMANAIDEGALVGDHDPNDFVGSYDASAGEFNLDNCFMGALGSTLLDIPAVPKFRVKFIPAAVDEAGVAEAEVVAVEYYSVDGRRLSAPAEGSMTIRRRVFSDGTAATDKLFR